jgi:CubicO group peptidase (beta-lactamase class C family)
VASQYLEAGIRFEPGLLPGSDDDLRPGALRRMVERLAAIPLLSEPGAAFHYGHSLDVLGCVLEEVTGRTLGELLRAEIFEPLGMVDTAFAVRPADVHRFAACYELQPQGGFRLSDPPASSAFLTPREHLCGGGGGLVSTLRDYARFVAMLAGNGACPAGAPFGGASRRLLSRTSVDFMMSDQLPPGVSVPCGLLHCRDGVGFGIGGSVTKSAARNALVGATFSWGSAANGYMAIDPAEGLSFIMLTQVTPSFKLCRWRRELQSLLQGCIE